MVDLETYLTQAFILVPLVSALLCGTGVWMSLRDSVTRYEWHLKGAAVRYFGWNLLSGIGFFLLTVYPNVVLRLNPLFLVAFMLYNVEYYRVVFWMTRTDADERFGRIHYLLPLLVAVLVMLLKLTVPLNDHFRHLLESNPLPTVDEGFTTFLITSRRAIEMLYVCYYTLVTMRRIYAYFKKLYNEEEPLYSPARWMVVMVLLSLALMVSSLICIAIPRSSFGVSGWTLFFTLSLMLFHIHLSYRMVIRRFEVYALSQPEGARHQYRGKITIRRLDRYFRHQKPYLNRNYRMTDLVTALDVSRTRLSQFINQAYGINFSTYLNRWRLRELEQLQQSSRYADKPLEGLVQQAGFTDMKHYRRAVLQSAEEAIVGATRKGEDADE
ncbi:MAG: hypothetical protein LBM06_07085 [Prevotellaceae bacterium]|jgi:AraC-like DNA-binding protein|nr:hypothetical protein [Prevotellaceae bacterium]